MKKIAVLTSGGDSPGMNACLRAVVRSAAYHSVECTGIRNGYEGMIDGDYVAMHAASVSNIIQRGGTILGTARSVRFLKTEFRKQAAQKMKSAGIEGVIIVGGDCSFTGASVFFDEHKIPCIGIPGTIDNDLGGTDYTLGYDTALNTVVEAIDKIRDTAAAHHRIFFVEVMGRDSGYIALNAGIASGAEDIVIPETETDVEKLIAKLKRGHKRQKQFAIVVVAEGDERGGAFGLAERVKSELPDAEIRVSVLGHMQRGGNPSCKDRLLAARYGYAAVQALLQNKTCLMTGEINNEIVLTPFSEVLKKQMPMKEDVLKMIEILGC